jgi:2-polyprenyl-6-methoxyphenol hydroxylase-like FAD-dependent oxidoreductase
MGVDVQDLGATCLTTFRSTSGYIRAAVNLPEHIIDQYQGGFTGLLRPDLYPRMLKALPPRVLHLNRTIQSFMDDGTHMEVTFSDGQTANTPSLIGTNGTDSMVRRKLWPDA